MSIPTSLGQLLRNNRLNTLSQAFFFTKIFANFLRLHPESKGHLVRSHALNNDIHIQQRPADRHVLKTASIETKIKGGAYLSYHIYIASHPLPKLHMDYVYSGSATDTCHNIDGITVHISCMPICCIQISTDNSQFGKPLSDCLKEQYYCIEWQEHFTILKSLHFFLI